MRRSSIISNLGVALAASIALAGPAEAQSTTEDREQQTASARETLRRVQDRYAEIETFSADFKQLYSGHNVSHEESGILLMKKPAKMYWEYLSPRKKLFVADGKKAYFYVPEDRQVMESDLRLDSSDNPLLFLFGEADVEEDFRVSFESAESPSRPGNVLIRLEPKRPRGEFSEIQLEINPESRLIERLRVTEPIGNRNDYYLTNFRENVRLSDRKFKFKIPKGTEIIRQ